MDVGSKAVFVTDPVEQLKGLVPLKGIPGNTDGTGSPFFGASGFPGLLQIHLQAPVQLKQGIGKDGYQALSVLVIVVDIQIEQNHNDNGCKGKSGIDLKHDPDGGYKAHQGDVPALERKGRSVGGCRSKMMQEGDQAQGSIGDHKKHGDDPGHLYSHLP